MTHKEIAERLREIAESGGAITHQRLQHFANELDPPRPEPGTVVWWQDFEKLGDPVLGQFNDLGRIELFGSTQLINPDNVRYWPAHILGSRQVAVDVPPVSKWPEKTYNIALRWHYENKHTVTIKSEFADVALLRSVAERMEADE